MRMTGNTILITGGGSGLGRGFAEQFHKLGNRVIIAGRREAVLEQTVADNPGMDWVQLDVSNAKDIEHLASAIVERFPGLNVLINNAGVQRNLEFNVPGGADMHQADEEINTNVRGLLHLTNAMLPHFRHKEYAAVVNVSSGLAYVPLAQYPVYCASKAFVHSFTQSLRYQLRGTRIEVIELAPPWVHTNLDALHDGNEERDTSIRMTMEDFIPAAMAELATDTQEKQVGTAKMTYAGVTSMQAAEQFRRMNP